ncbi:DUF5343 domain-containing protein [Porticoccus sp.]|uniref:DUF5343 domain-containing protein n=1 Tax=Porticoccus sp. TaxID=2024853 RepID=UPI0025E53447|nr:DUF5343 domain-containing protein [Porticoccus sp.]|tara:strand:+ start:87 stop:779 length:693 start_codon:yes stop_codon:yes gene_type:complete
MADSHPYISGPGNISLMVSQLRKSFPTKVNSDTVKKLGLAPNNESHLINALQFIGLLDSEGTKTSQASSVFSHHKDEEFSKAFSELVEAAYSALFELHGESTWGLDNDDLITFFRQNDQTGDAIGRRQANTFKVFAALSGHGEVPVKRGGNKNGSSTENKKTKSKPKPKSKANPSTPLSVDLGKNSGAGQKNGNRDIGLTVRVEINLPADGTKETYDAIFKSIKENLIDA